MSVGKAHIIDGDVYYSPNCTKKLTSIPTVVRNKIDINPFYPGGRSVSLATVDDVLRPGPRPWSKAFGWLAFIPLRPSYTSHPFDRLASVNVPIEVSGNERGYIAPENLVASWKELEDNIYGSVMALKTGGHIAMVLPFRPSSRGLSGIGNSPKDMLYRVKSARDWFTIWMGALSYLIASANLIDYNSFEDCASRIPSWAKILQEYGYGYDWMDTLCLSSVVSFTPEHPRLGTILSLDESDPTYPTVAWFVLHHVPVWYKWGASEEALSQKRPHLNTLRPPPEALQALHGSIQIQTVAPVESNWEAEEPTTATVASETSRDGSRIAPEYSAQTPDDLPYWSPTSNNSIPDETLEPQPSWVHHFRALETKEKSWVAAETEKQRQARISRLRDPATAGAHVFEWDEDELSDEANLVTYRRKEVIKALRVITLDNYGPSQKVYNALFNTWDCCSAWGPGQDSDSDSDYEGLPGGPPLRHTVVAGPVAEPPDQYYANGNWSAGEHLQAEGECSPQPSDPKPVTPTWSTGKPSPHPSDLEPVHKYVSIAPLEPDVHPDLYPSSATDSSESVQAELSNIFHLFYGFLPPLPDQEISRDGIPDRSQQLSIRVSGIDNELYTVEYLASKHSIAIEKFFHVITSKAQVPSELWDLNDNSIKPLKFAARLKYIKRLPASQIVSERLAEGPTHCYVFDLPQPSVPWKVAVSTPQNALLVCRLPEHFGEMEIVFYLAQRGVAFRTLANFPLVERPLLENTLPGTIPKRPFDYAFSKADFNSYVHLRTMMLRQPHMQAAIKRGGLLWRLSTNTVDLGRVTNGPTSLCSRQITFTSGAETFIDNELSPLEMQLLCGAYDCVSGKPSLLYHYTHPSLFMITDNIINRR